MHAGEITLTERDRLVLASYNTLMDGLEDYMGEGYEMVLHSLESFEHSVVKIVNGHHTGRKVGAPITDLALTMLGRIREEGGGSYISYFTRNKKGEPLKSTTIAITGEHGKVIGLLCINFYLNTTIASLVETMIAPSQHSMLLESFGESTTELIGQAVEQARSDVMGDMNVLSSLKNREIVSRLNSQGIFKIKNAVEPVAEEMGISRNTVYLHLRNLNA